MKREITIPQARLYLFGMVILLGGLLISGIIYQTAGDDSGSPPGYEIIDGKAYPVAPENSKTYVHDLEVFGGKSAVLADNFRRWFTGLWHGKSLAWTIACGAGLISLGCFLAAARMPRPDVRKDDSPVGRS